MEPGVMSIVLVIVGGTMLAAYGDLHYVWFGVVLQLVAITAEALRLVFVQKLLTSNDIQLDPLSGLYYFAPVSTRADYHHNAVVSLIVSVDLCRFHRCCMLDSGR